jgi:hypothetical protein
MSEFSMAGSHTIKYIYTEKKRKYFAFRVHTPLAGQNSRLLQGLSGLKIMFFKALRRLFKASTWTFESM